MPSETIAVRATNGDVALVGSVWPIREVLVGGGVAVASFDKRGVGESTGSWLDAGIHEQADDLTRSLAAARAVVPGGDHRLQTPRGDAFVPGNVEALIAFVARIVL